mmetsp:Transcript_123315/g.308016  ORF Transcript_123315/g.308016 Transcript_123315/m.308016 type:complete len:208 (+) Transcript_123315:336-959(+)
MLLAHAPRCPRMRSQPQAAALQEVEPGQRCMLTSRGICPSSGGTSSRTPAKCRRWQLMTVSADQLHGTRFPRAPQTGSLGVQHPLGRRPPCRSCGEASRPSARSRTLCGRWSRPETQSPGWRPRGTACNARSRRCEGRSRTRAASSPTSTSSTGCRRPSCGPRWQTCRTRPRGCRSSRSGRQSISRRSNLARGRRQSMRTSLGRWTA